MKNLFLLSLIGLLVSCSKKPKGEAPIPPFLVSENKNSTPTYEEGIAFWEKMAAYYDEISIEKYGMTDEGLPLHIVIVDGERPKPLGAYKQSLKQVLLINNAIHPGEPDGVDASMVLVHNLMTDPQKKQLLSKTSLVIIPFYNIGGTLNRNKFSRTNQNGPEEYGFRGNAQNLDLNRDFIKCDSENAKTFATLINELDPDLYIETHVSNGADYQYVITYLSTQEDKIGGQLGKNLREAWTPFLKDKMSKQGFEMCPYVNVHNESPKQGYATFYDQPRYSTGYLALLQIPGYITETHMLKPYEQRVNATLAFLESGLELLDNVRIRNQKIADRKELKTQKTFAIDWQIDSTSVSQILFKGYESGYKPSEVTGEKRLFYNREKAYSANIPFYEYMKPTKTVETPKYYILKRGFVELEKRLLANGVVLQEMGRDTVLEVTIYRIETLETSTVPYEKHYFHYQTGISKATQKVHISKYDYVLKLDNNMKRFLIETLEPEAPDSYFNWNFFDAVLQQKEWFSAYVFEDEAAEILKKDSVLNQKFMEMKKDLNFAQNPQQQLVWIYQNSHRYEKEHLTYPVFRVE